MRAGAWTHTPEPGGAATRPDGGLDGETGVPDTIAEVIAWQRKFCNDGYFDASDPADILAFLDPRAITEIGRSLDSLLPSERRPVRWKRGELLGSGAFGRVYLGLNEEDGTLMAAKQISLQVYGISGGGGGGAEDMEELLELMEREISLMSRLRHDNIVQYIGCQRDEYVSAGGGSGGGGPASSSTSAAGGAAGGRREEFLTIFMEYIPGGSIASLLKRFGKLNETLVRIYTRQILMGLAYLHAHG
jgi:serine/threonine protein kinase